jgi:hypothetical protein
VSAAEGVVGAVSGFKLMLPDDWVMLDLNPETAAESVRQVIEGMIRVDPKCAERRADVEEVLSVMTEEAIAEGTLMRGVRFGVDPEGRPVQAAVSVTLEAVEGPTDPDSLFEQLDDESADARIAALDSGPALRLRRLTDEGFLSWAAFVPVPGVDGAVAVVSLRSPSLHYEEQLDTFFDGLIESFRFTTEEEGGADD